MTGKCIECTDCHIAERKWFNFETEFYVTEIIAFIDLFNLFILFCFPKTVTVRRDQSFPIQ